MIFKICGLKNEKSLLCCEKNKADFFGMIFYEKSPRNITFNEAETLIKTSKKLRIKPVGVFVDHEINDLKKIISYLSLKHIQLHGNEDQLYINEIKNQFDIKIIKKNAASFQIYARIIPKPYLSLTKTGKSPGLLIKPS